MSIDSLIQRAKEQGIDLKTFIMLERFEADIARDPGDAEAYCRIGRWWHRMEEYAKAMHSLDTALTIDPHLPYALCTRADIYATCPDAVYRNASCAVRDARKSIEVARTKGMLIGDWRQRMFLRVLAAAYAESGDFVRAIEIERESMTFAITKSAKRKIEHHIHCYQNGLPIREAKGTW